MDCFPDFTVTEESHFKYNDMIAKLNFSLLTFSSKINLEWNDATIDTGLNIEGSKCS